MKMNVTVCSRCEGSHSDLELKEFQIPVEDDDYLLFNYWAMCPTAGEPILILVEEPTVS